MTGGVEAIEYSRPHRIYAVGDSNSLAFRDLLVRIPGTHESAFFYTTYIGGLFAKHIKAGAGLDPRIRSLLSTYALVDKDDQPLHLSRSTDVQSNIYASGQPLISPVLLIIAGDIDLRNDIYPMLAGDADLILPSQTPYGYDSGAQIVPMELI